MPTDNFKKEVQKVNSAEVALLLVKLSHPDWVDDIRVVGNTSAVTHNGDVYAPYGVSFKAPTNGKDTYTTSLVIEDITGLFVSKFDDVFEDIDIELFIILSSNPDQIEQGTWKLSVATITYSDYKVTLNLEKKTILKNSLSSYTLNESDFPGAFLL